MGSACECTGVAFAQEHPDRAGLCWGAGTQRGEHPQTLTVGVRPRRGEKHLCRGGGWIDLELLRNNIWGRGGEIRAHWKEIIRGGGLGPGDQRCPGEGERGKVGRQGP